MSAKPMASRMLFGCPMTFWLRDVRPEAVRAGHECGILQDVHARDHDDDQVQRQVDGDEADRDADGLAETLEEDDSERGDEQEGQQLVLPVKPCRHQRVLGEVLRRIRRRQGDGDHEVGDGEAEQHEHEELAGPPGQQPLEHRDGTRAPETLLGDPAIDGKCAEQRQRDQHDGRERREELGRKKRDRGRVPQRREVVDAREAHDLPPRVGALAHLGVRSLGRAMGCREVAEQPCLEVNAAGQSCLTLPKGRPPGCGEAGNGR